MCHLLDTCFKLFSCACYEQSLLEHIQLGFWRVFYCMEALNPTTFKISVDFNKVCIGPLKKVNAVAKSCIVLPSDN